MDEIELEEKEYNDDYYIDYADYQYEQLREETNKNKEEIR